MGNDADILVFGGEHLTTPELLSALTWAGFNVGVVAEEQDVLGRIAEASPDLIVADVSTHSAKVQSILSQFNDLGIAMPVILVGHGGPIERAYALDRGADDYLVVPFHEVELIARIRVVLRRSLRENFTVETSYRLRSGMLVIDRLSRRVWLEEEPILLTPKGFALLEYLMTHPDQLISRDVLLDEVWGWDYPVGIRAVDTRIFELRKALGDTRAHPQYIETVSGVGYRFIGAVVDG